MPRARSTACCCGATSSCPTGTATPPTSPTGTASAARPRAPSMRPSPSTRGGSTRPRTRLCSAAGRRSDLSVDGLAVAAYILRRLLLVIPTLLGIMVINFFVIQAAPGGPVEQMISQIQGTSVDATERFSGSATGGETVRSASADTSGGGGAYRGARGLPKELIQRIEKMYGFDKPIGERFLLMMKNYLMFDFGESFFRNKKVVDLVIEKMPVSISLGLWTTLLIYFISIPLGIAKAVRDGSRFDLSSSTTLIVLNAIPGFLFALLLV